MNFFNDLYYMWYLLALILLIVVIIIKLQHVGGPWEHSSKVIHGYGMARHADWRTANLAECPRNSGEKGFYSCMTNYGKASLIKSDRGTCEVHIHDFKGDIYGKELRLKDLKQEEIPFGLSHRE